MPVKPIPDGFHAITPYFAVHGATRLLEFLERAFDAAVGDKAVSPDGRLMNATVRIGDSMVMVGESPAGRPPMRAMLYHYVADCDATYRRALAAGGRSLSEPADMFYGDRHAGVEDPCGNQWWIATHIEDISPEEMRRREAEHFAARKA